MVHTRRLAGGPGFGNYSDPHRPQAQTPFSLHLQRHWGQATHRARALSLFFTLIVISPIPYLLTN